MEVKKITVGSYATNCYVAWCPETKTGIVIDPGFEPERIAREIDQLGVGIVAIVNTHGHLDHIGGNGPLKERWDCPLYIGAGDAAMLSDPGLNCSAHLGKPVTSPQADHLLQDGDNIRFGHCVLKVLATPGHTPGGICLLGAGLVFVGDTLFAGSVGRSDLPGGDQDTLLASIKDKLLALSPTTCVLPGHGIDTSIGEEMATNPWLQG